jgi:hypothetical protein
MDEPVIPMATPRRDERGRITYVGEDGRRYAVEVSPAVPTTHDGIEAGGEDDIDVDVFRQMEDLARRWLRSALPPNLRREDAVTLLLSSLERSLRNPDEPGTSG